MESQVCGLTDATLMPNSTQKFSWWQKDVPCQTCGMSNTASSFSVRKSGSEGDTKSQPYEENKGQICYLCQFCLGEAKDW